MDGLQAQQQLRPAVLDDASQAYLKNKRKKHDLAVKKNKAKRKQTARSRRGR